jgi:ComF family protein
MVFPSPPCCDACGLPFEYDLGEGTLCAACIGRRPVFARARSAMIYDASSRDLVLAFKHGDRTDAAPAFARWMVRAGDALIAEADVLVPVPLHWSRVFNRRYNQAALLAHAIGRITSLPVSVDALFRHRRTPSLGKLSPSVRRRTLRGAFRVRARREGEIRGCRVLLVDDVLTTGATASGCATVMLKAGAARVDLLTLARVLRPLPL